MLLYQLQSVYSFPRHDLSPDHGFLQQGLNGWSRQRSLCCNLPSCLASLGQSSPNYNTVYCKARHEQVTQEAEKTQDIRLKVALQVGSWAGPVRTTSHMQLFQSPRG